MNPNDSENPQQPVTPPLPPPQSPTNPPPPAPEVPQQPPANSSQQNTVVQPNAPPPVIDTTQGQSSSVPAPQTAQSTTQNSPQSAATNITQPATAPQPGIPPQSQSSPSVPNINTATSAPVAVPWYRKYWIFGAIFILLPGGLIIGTLILLTGGIYRKKNGVYVPISTREKITLIVLAILLTAFAYIIPFLSFILNKNQTLTKYESFTTATGTISSVISSEKTSWSIDYPDGMSPEQSSISNMFVATGYSEPEDEEDATLISLIDFRPDSATILNVTETEEMNALDNPEFVSLMDQALEQGLETNSGMSADLTYGGKTTIGKDNLQAYYYAGNATNKAGAEWGTRVYIGYDGDIRFSVALMGQTSGWPEIGSIENEEGWWQHVVDSVEFN